MAHWTADDELGSGYEQHTIDLGQDPDGEGPIVATLVRRDAPADVRGVVLHVHGFSDYFFQRELADFFTERGFAFYALDLRKCGRSRREGQIAHYVSDLAMYDVELDQAVDIIGTEHPDVPLVLEAHSTGGLILPLWLDRRRRVGDSPADALILNSPWFDLQGKAWMRSVGTQAIRGVARVRPKDVIKLPPGGTYGSSLHVSQHGEWDFNTVFKPIEGFPVTFGWLNAVRRGQSALHRGLDVGVPALVLRSTRTWFGPEYRPDADRADAVLDVKQIARWSGCLGGPTVVAPVEGAKHDVFLSQKDARDEAYETVDRWLADQELLAR